jgi:hypothetical protein
MCILAYESKPLSAPTNAWRSAHVHALALASRRRAAPCQADIAVHAASEARTAAAAPGAPCLVGVMWTQTASARKEVENVGQTHDARQPARHAGHGGGRQRAAAARTQWRVRRRRGAACERAKGWRERGWCEGGGGGTRGRGRRFVDDPHAVRARGDELGNGVRERREWVDVEDGKGVLAIVHAALRKDYGNEVDAAGAQKRQGRCRGEKLCQWELAMRPLGPIRSTYPCINVRYVANNIGLVVEDWQGRDGFTVHELQRVCHGFVAAG